MKRRIVKLVGCTVFALAFALLSGCMYLSTVNDIDAAAKASYFGYNRDLSINSEPQGAYVIIKEDDTYKTLGQTPLKYHVDLNGSNSYFKVTLAHPGFHSQDVRIISGVANCQVVNESRRHVARDFVVDCFFLIPIPFNILIGVPRYAGIPIEAFSCDYLGAKIVYANEVIKLIPDNVPLPQEIVAQPMYNYAPGVDSAVIAAEAITQGANAFSAAMAQQQQNSQPIVVNQPVVQPQPVRQNPTLRPTTVKPYHREIRPPSFYVGSNPDGSMKVSDQSWRDRKRK